jgi:uncharacterized protein (TIGR02271 family)
MGMNTRTLVATFADYSTARKAARDLEYLGIPPDSINIHSNQKTAGAGTTMHREERHESGFAGWWNNLFGSDRRDVDRSDYEDYDYENDRRGYEGALESGRAVLRATVAPEIVDRAVEVMNRYGAEGGSDTRAETEGRGADTREGKRGPIEVIEEELRVGVRAVQRGAVRIYSHVVDRPVEEKVRLREEHINVERRPVDREISPNEVSALRDQTVEVTEVVEEPVVTKRARVREEVVVGKQSTERTETVRDNVRRTEVEVEQLGAEGKRAGRAETRGDAGTVDLTSDYRQHYIQTYGSETGFDTARPAYEYGYRSATDARYSGRSWDQVENDLRSDYERSNPGGAWERVKSAVRHGWEKVTGKR